MIKIITENVITVSKFLQNSSLLHQQQDESIVRATTDFVVRGFEDVTWVLRCF
jgi:hypothetical protein